MLLAVVGKGGAGKSVLSGTLARVLARRGKRVLALDSDTQPGISYNLGAHTPEQPPLMAAVERREGRGWKYVDGVGAVRTVQRYAIDAPDGVRLLQIGKHSRDCGVAHEASVNAFYMTVHRLQRAPAFRDWVILGDLPAGPRQMALGWAPYADGLLVVVEPTWQSMLTARRIKRISTAATPDTKVSLVVSKATGADDARRIGHFLEQPVLAVVPADEEVHRAERAGVAVLDHAPDCAAVQAIEQLADELQAHGARSPIDGPPPPIPCGCGSPPRQRARRTARTAR